MVLFVVVLIGAVMVVGIVILFQYFLAPHRPRHHHTTGVREEHPTSGGGCGGHTQEAANRDSHDCQRPLGKYIVRGGQYKQTKV